MASKALQLYIDCDLLEVIEQWLDWMVEEGVSLAPFAHMQFVPIVLGQLGGERTIYDVTLRSRCRHSRPVVNTVVANDDREQQQRRCCYDKMCEALKLVSFGSLDPDVLQRELKIFPPFS